MTFSFSIDSASLAQMGADLEARFSAVQPQVEAWMAGRYYQVVMSNFGPTGIDRPWAWRPLSQKYAEIVGRTYATLLLSPAEATKLGAVPGLLMQSVHLDGSTVSMSDEDCPYAFKHHAGQEVPARRVFPMDTQGNVTPLTAREVEDAAIEKLREVMP